MALSFSTHILLSPFSGSMFYVSHCIIRPLIPSHTIFNFLVNIQSYRLMSNVVDHIISFHFYIKNCMYRVAENFAREEIFC